MHFRRPVLKGLDLLECVQLVSAHIKALGCFGQLTEGSDPTKLIESKQFLSKNIGIDHTFLTLKILGRTNFRTWPASTSKFA